MPSAVVLEVCADSVESAIAAEHGGAQRIELCSDLLEGGITPSAGLIAQVCAAVSIGVQVMIRPRGGDFCYTAGEFEVMKQDAEYAKRLGARGLVFGLLTDEGHVDVGRTAELVALAHPLNVTFHRAFDMSVDLDRALEDVIQTGANRILTSGGDRSVEDSLTTISQFVQAAKNRIAIMVGGSVRETNVGKIIAGTGVREIHANLQESVPSPMRYRNDKMAMGASAEREYERTIVREERVRGLLAAAMAAG